MDVPTEVVIVDDIPVVVPDEDTEEDTDMEEDLDEMRGALIQEMVTEKVQEWLDAHGAQLFALEYSKADVKAQKKSIKQFEEKRKLPLVETDKRCVESVRDNKRRRF